MSRQSLALLASGLLVLGLVAGSVGVTAASAPEIESAIAFTDDGQFDAGHVFVEVRFDRAIANSSVEPADFGVELRDGWVQPDAVRQGAQDDDRQFLLDLGPASQAVTSTKVTAVSIDDGATITDTSGTDFAGTEIRNASAISTSTTLTEGATGTDRTAFRGETVAVVGDQAGEDLTVRPLVGTDIVRLGPVQDDGQVYALNTTEFPYTRYTAAFDGNSTANLAGGDRLLELWNLTMDLQVTPNRNVGDATVTDVENVTGTIETNAADEQLLLTISDGDSVIRRTDAVTDGSGEVAFDFAPIELEEADDHFFVTAVHTISGTTAVERIKVSQIDYHAGFADSHRVQNRGDVVEIPVVMSPTPEDKVAVNQATVTIGSPDSGYQANLTVGDWNDDQDVLIHWNTYMADGQGGNTEFWVEPTKPTRPDDTLTVEDISTSVAGPPGDVLDAGEYEVTVRYGADSADTAANETMPVWLTDRSTDAIETYTAPTGEDRELEDLDSLRDGMAEGWVTPAETLTEGDRAIVAIRASGIQGAIETGPDTNTTETFSRFVREGAALRSVQADPGPNRAPKVLNLSAGTTRVFANESNETYYAVVSLSGVEVARDTDGDENVSAGDAPAALASDDRFNTTFEIPETDGGLAETDETASVHWTYQQPDATVDRERVEGERMATVTPQAGQALSGTTTLAPGSLLELRVRSDNRSVMYFETAEVTVDRNRTWRGQFDLTGVPTGTDLSISVVHEGKTLAEETGLVVRGAGATAEPPEPTTREPETTTAPPSTQTPPETTTSPTSSTDTQSAAPATTTADPGAGTSTGSAPLGPVAYLGLLAGLLLAVRRR